MGMIKSNGTNEGELFNRWMHSRMIRKNKNVLTATTGPTGSGKSYQDLRKVELWYEHYFKKEFPIENCCFSISEVMRRLSSKELVKGDVLILEEAGANLGSLDFQNKVSKLFTYVLQTFRSLNIALFFNLPYLSMLNKQARMLIHVQFITCGIDNETGVSKCKAYFRQINQNSGKIYSKYLRVKNNGRTVPVKKITYTLPSEKLCKQYEAKKFKFVNELTVDFSEMLDKIEKDKIRKDSRKDLTEVEQRVFDLFQEGLSQGEIAKKLGQNQGTVSRTKTRIVNKGYVVEMPKKTK